jgi:branched-chain amino acid aminotransferase
VPAVSVDPRIQQRSRLVWWLAEQEVHGRDPFASALLLDGTGRLTETAAANLLLVENDHVWTPRRSGVLGGVSLAVIEELCRDLDIPFGEADLTYNDCQTADEAMLSCTSFCLAPVRRIEERELTCPGPVYERLLHAWSDRVGVDIREQVLSGGSEGRK